MRILEGRPDMDVQDRRRCERSIRRIQALFSSGIFEPNNAGNVLQYSAFIDLTICLRDLLIQTQRYVRRIAFTDDIVTNDYVKDVTDAVTVGRDACCHIDSFKKLFHDRGDRGSYMVVYGKCDSATIDDRELKSEYEDDTAIFIGTNRLYLKRHIVRAFDEARTLLGPYLADQGA
jgi:hypothetical protein